MFFCRTAAARSLLRATRSPNNASIIRPCLPKSAFRAQLTTSSRSPELTRRTTLALTTRKPVTTALVRHASAKASAHDPKADDLIEDPEADMTAGIRNDMKTIKETFSLREVPKEALYLGLAGVLPYLATSTQTAYLAWEMNNAITTGSGYFISGETAELLMSVVEPIQIGYGAVILSFLGAVHWGLEWAEYGGKIGYRRYATGVVAPAVAWPTLLMAPEYALISQFLAFTFLYYNDARAAVKGWTPSWYAMYRFVLTFVVGASIVFSLMGREQLSSHYISSHGIAGKVQTLRSLQKKEETTAAAVEEKEDGEEDAE